MKNFIGLIFWWRGFDFGLWWSHLVCYISGTEACDDEWKHPFMCYCKKGYVDTRLVLEGSVRGSEGRDKEDQEPMVGDDGSRGS